MLHDEDANVILVCSGHAGLLLEMRRDGRAARLLEALRQEFGFRADEPMSYDENGDGRTRLVIV